MKQMVSSIAALVLGIGAGVGIGMMLSKSKINDSQTMIEELMTQMQASKAESEEAIRKANVETTQAKNNLSRNQASMSQLNTELSRLKAELAEAKRQNSQLVSPPVTIVAETEAASIPASTVSTAVSSSTASVDYTVKEGDSLWKIAEEQLGDGMRYKEILRLNPTITENQTLKVGMKLKIPSQQN